VTRCWRHVYRSLLYEIGTFARLNLGAAISLERLCAYLKGALDELQNLGWRPLAQIQERLRCWMGNMLLKLNVLETGQLQRFPTFRLSERRFASMRSMRSTGSDGIG
jgi:hypothetical protein